MPKLYPLILGTLILGTLFSVFAEDSEVKTARPKQDSTKLPARAFDLPKITAPGGGDRYMLGSNVARNCSISPAIATGIDATIYHVKDNGDLVLMSSFHFSTDSNGRAGFAFGPPFGQWRAGKAMIVLEPNMWPQQRQKIELEFVGQDGQNVNQEFVARPITEAKTVCDISDSVELKTIVEPGQRFLVRGRLQVENYKDAEYGPFVVVDLTEPKLDAAGVPQRLFHQSASTMSVRAKNGEFGFELEVRAPEVSQNFLLKVRSLAGTVVDARKSPESVERVLTVKAKDNP